MITAEVVNFCAERRMCVGNTYLSTGVYKVHKGGKRSRQSGDKEDNRSGVGKEGYAALCAGCEYGERNGMRTIRSPCSIV